MSSVKWRKVDRKQLEALIKKRTVAKVFATGDLVLVEETQCGGGKLKAKYKGPFEILKCLLNERYVLKRVNGQMRTTVAGQDQMRLAA